MFQPLKLSSTCFRFPLSRALTYGAMLLVFSGMLLFAAPTPIAPPSPTATLAGAPRFFSYASPQGIADSFGEPSIGSNWTTEQSFSNSGGSIPNGGRTLFFGGFSPALARITFNDCSSPAGALWEPKTLLTANSTRVYGDPIMFTDHDTGRTFVSQLEGLTPAGSTTDITDNDGDSFLPSEGSSLPSDLDHQTIGGGRFHAPLVGTVYPNAVYYASQSIADARAALSITGGFTFGPGFPMYVVAQCAGLHGHVKVAPNDGTVYVPQKACGNTIPFHDGDLASAIVSEDNGTTWTIRPIPAALTHADRDPSIGIATDGTVYEGYQAMDGHARIAVTHDKGVTWSTPYDVGAQLGIQNMAFPEVVAGDPNRATFAFFGSTTPGQYDDPNFPGAWYVYVASTFDGGVTWTTQNVTLGDPVQRGGICGSANPTCRNHLDFQDMTIDKEGRVLMGYTDGCVTASCINGGNNDFTAKGKILRQSGGKRMYAAYDPIEPAVPGAPKVSGSVNGTNTVVTLTWPVPDNGGSPITAYKVSRGPSVTGPFTLLATTTVNNYTDTTFDPNVQNFYIVTAVNTIGEGPYCGALHPVPGQTLTPCVLPGILVNDDINPDGTDNDAGANLPPDPRVNVRQLFIAEPFFGAGVNKLVFTMQMQPSPTLTTPPLSSQFYIVWQRLFPDPDFDRWFVAMKTDVTGVVSYQYGKFGVPLDPMNPNPNANIPVTLGVADSGTYDPVTGVIRITLSNSNAENISAGQSLSRINVRTYFMRPDAGPKTQGTASDITGDGTYTLVGNASCAMTVPLLDIVSRKNHGTAGAFDIHLPLTGASGIECRSGGPSGNYTIVFTFANPVASVAGATLTGTGSVASRMIDSSNPNRYIVNLTGVTTPQNIMVTLTGITDTAGNNTPSLAAPVAILVGDTNADRFVNSGDSQQTRNRSGQLADGTNFRSDVNTDGTVNSGDSTIVRARSGDTVPAQPAREPAQK
ncbi:MAG: hypothetical protein ABJB09_03525 [Verrucomicrobiota bacterium]